MGPLNAIEDEGPDPRLKIQTDFGYLAHLLSEIEEASENVVAQAEVMGPRHVRILLARPGSEHDHTGGNLAAHIRDRRGER